MGKPRFEDSAASDMLAGGIYNPEILLEGWTSASFILMTTALLFYHMTKAKSIEMNSRIAGIFAVAMMTLSIVFEVQALVIYMQRITRLKTLDDNSSVRQEMVIGNCLAVIIGVLIIVQLCIGVTILRGSFRKEV